MFSNVLDFLHCETPNAWLDRALLEQDILLIDHANCEKKAAATAMNLMYRHTQRADLLSKMSQLAREELLHFQQVVEILAAREIKYVRLSPSRYAASLRSMMENNPAGILIDTLIIGAYIEARSCERFAKLAPLLDPELQKFYRSLLKSESRHFEDYLSLARRYASESVGGAEAGIEKRIEEFGLKEAELISTVDDNFRFHSGVPA